MTIRDAAIMFYSLGVITGMIIGLASCAPQETTVVTR